MDPNRSTWAKLRVAHLWPLLLAALVATPAGAMSVFQSYELTGATITPTGGSAAPLAGTFELLRGPICLLLPTGPACTDPPQWSAGDFDLAGGGLTIQSGVLEPTAFIGPVFSSPILLDPVAGLQLLPIVLKRELLVDNAAGQVFLELRLAPLSAASEQVTFDPVTDFHPTLLSLVYELQERVATISFPQPPEIGLPTLTGETITALATVELNAQLPEPGTAALLGLCALVLAGSRTRRGHR